MEEHLRHAYRPYCMHVTPTESLSPAFTAADSIVILANTFVQAGVIIDGARQELMKPDDECVTLLVNGKAIAVMDLMHALVDRIARLCQARCPLEEFEDREVCFSTYSFRCSTYVDLSPLQRDISKLRYMGTDPCAFMRGLQHREPWIGPVSVREDDGVSDGARVAKPPSGALGWTTRRSLVSKFVGETHKSNMWCMAPHICHIYDDQGVGLLEDFLFPIYKLIREMLMRLAHTHLVPPDDLPHF